MSLLKKTVIFLAVLTLSLFIVSSKAIIYAQVPAPVVDCGQVSDEEFHSLRPYQASPCSSEVAPYASFCGNNLTLKETIPARYPGGGGICNQIGGKIVCKFNVSVPAHTVTIDLSGANLPIMGNTEDVANSQSSADTLDDAQKTNEYVSWYLNGVIDRAEYGSTKNTDSNIVNFSGPIKKLLPSVIQEAQRIDTIQAAGITRHNQIAVCAQEGILGIWGKTKAHECYEGNGTAAKPDVYRLDNWDGDLSLLRAVLNLINPFDAWNKRIPPLPWNFESDILYRKAYNEWRGKSCLILPIIGLQCIDNPLIRNKWADLFPYIPLSSTEDKKGGIMIDSVSSATQGSSGITVANVTFSNQKPADLFFTHMQEVDELGEILQGTFAQKDADLTGSPTGVEPASCDMVDVRSNKGDSLFAGEISGSLAYSASFSCEFNPITPSKIPGPPQTCSKDVYISLSTKSAVPNIENVWARLVAGPSSIFKRIFPKLGTYIGTIKDIPGSTAITYSGGGVSENTDLKLPHIGGISEYFLKGIQTILRPKGYGETIIFGETTGTTCTPGSAGNIPNLPAGSGACKLTSTSIGGITLPPTMVSILETAAQSYNVPPGLILGVMYGEGAFNPGRYDWTEDNVKKWSMGCASMPGCSPTSFPSTGVVPFFENYWNQIKDAVKIIDPNRNPNPCNLLDATFALAKDLQKSQNGSGAFIDPTTKKPRSCYGINLNAGGDGSGSCSWDNSDYETAIRVWEFGTAYNSTYTCATKLGSCATGGGSAAACPGGDFCEKVGGSGNTSHNACVWNVAHSH